MGLWKFGKKKDQEPEGSDLETSESQEEDSDFLDSEDDEDVADHPTVKVDEYLDRGDVFGPWDVDDENMPDDEDYVDLGAYLLPVVPGMELRVKANRASQQVVGCIVSYGRSSLEIEPFAAPKTLGLWDDVRDDLLQGNQQSSEAEGVFGMEVRLPVKDKSGRVLHTRIVGVDGPRWMLRGIFSGPAATQDNDESDVLNRFFSSIIVARGDEPLAPRDLIPMHAPLTPQQRGKDEDEESEAEGEPESGKNDSTAVPGKPKGPFNSDQQTEVKSTLSRGPMFSEVR